MAKRKTNTRTNNRRTTKTTARRSTKKQASRLDLAIVVLFILSILSAVLIYTKSGVIGVKLTEILGGLMGIIRYVLPIGIFAVAIKIACEDRDELSYKLAQYAIFLVSIATLMSTFQISSGELIPTKDLTEVMEAHHLPYVAQTIAYANFKDLYEKAEKAIYTEGPCFLNVLSPCPRGWGYPTDMLMQINKLAVETCYWPLYEVIDGRYVINYKPAKKLPIEEFLKPQKRFKHMFKPGNEWMIEEFQKEVDKRWEALLKLEETTNR